MTSRELVLRTLNHEPVARAPRDLWPSPHVETSRADELAEINLRFPSDIVSADFKYGPGKRGAGKPPREGAYTDAWGCTWTDGQRGAPGEVLPPPLADLKKAGGYQPPLELLETARFAKVNRACETTSRFVLARTDIRPFERLQALHGSEATLLGLARESKDLRTLLATVHAFYCREIALWAETDVDGVALGDEWGTAEGLRVSPEMWRDVFRPLYRDYCQVLRERDKFVFFRSGGNIADIFGDLVKIGVDAIHAEWSSMNVEKLAKKYRGKVAFWGGLDRPQVLVGGTPQEIREDVQRVRRALDFGSGGVIAQCPWEAGAPLRNIAAALEQWLMPLPMHA
jgi:hypothetical protein